LLCAYHWFGRMAKPGLFDPRASVTQVTERSPLRRRLARGSRLSRLSRPVSAHPLRSRVPATLARERVHPLANGDTFTRERVHVSTFVPVAPPDV